MSALTYAQLAQLDWAFHNPTATHRQADFYRLRAHFGEVNGDADPASILWLLGAAEVNENSGSQSAFIREYNKAQYEVRYGGSLTDAKMDAVSNEIALQRRRVRDITHHLPHPHEPRIHSLTRALRI